MSDKQENARIRNKVLGMYKDFVSEVDANNVLDLLIQEGIISIPIKQTIMHKIMKKDRCRALIDHLFYCSHEKSFTILREALKVNYHWIVERIDAPDTDSKSENNSSTDKRENDRIRNRVFAMYSAFVSEVEPNNGLDLLFQNGIISIDLKQKLMTGGIAIDRCRDLLDHLLCSTHEKSFIILRQALKEHYHWIVKRIDATETTDEHEDTHTHRQCREIEQEASFLDQGEGKHVFISYQWDNQAMTLKLANGLKEAGYKVWIDVENMFGSLVDGMSQAVENAAVVLICLSQKYKDSKNCKAEAEYAYERRTEVDIIPLLMQSKYKPDEWLGLITGTKIYYDFSREEKYDESLKSLIKALGNKGKAVKSEANQTSFPPAASSSHDGDGMANGNDDHDMIIVGNQTPVLPAVSPSDDGDGDGLVNGNDGDDMIVDEDDSSFSSDRIPK